MSSNDQSSSTSDTDVSRREFAKAAGAVTGGLGLSMGASLGDRFPWGDETRTPGDSYDEYDAGDIAHSTCGLCHSNCPIQVRISDNDADEESTAYVRKISGNPYAFQSTYPNGPMPYTTSPEDVATGDRDGSGTVDTDGWSLSGGRVCLKGQSGLQVAFDEYRVRQPLKRVGDRGDDEWTTISWEQAIDEIVNGDDELGHDGLDAYQGWAPEEEVMSDWEAVKNGNLSKEEFDARYEDALIDTDHPDLGPKSNQIIDMGGYRRWFIRPRFIHSSIGSTNSYHHAGVCGTSCISASHGSYLGPKGGSAGYQQPDIRNAEYIIAWGANPLVTTKGPVWTAAKISNARQDGMRMDVVDPRLSKTAEKADKWVPVKPGADAALAHGMARWIIEHERYDAQFLRNPSEAAAEADNEPNWSDATHLVLINEEARPKARPEDLGLEGSGFVAVDKTTGQPRATDTPFDGTLFVDTTINGQRVKSVFQLYKERVYEHTLSDYAEMAGVDVDDVVELADEWTSHGKQAAILQYRGTAQHANGYYTSRAVVTLQHLIGCYDWKGGQMTTFDARYAVTNGRYPLGQVPDEHDKQPRKPWGVPIARGGVKYEETSLYQEKIDNGEDPYPAERPWYSHPQVIQEVWPSAKDEYPYEAKALLLRAYGANNVMSAAGGDTIPDLMQDEDNFELIVACDTVIGETSRHADYILPEPTYLERWENFDANMNKVLKDGKLTRPVVQVFDGPRPFGDVLIDLCKEMDLPAVGEDALMDTEGRTYPLDHSYDFWVKLAANIAYDGEPVPDADTDEREILRASVAKGLGDESLVDQWRSAVAPQDWAKVVTVLNRGGRFEQPTEDYEEKFDRFGYDRQYVENDPETNAYEGEHLAYTLSTRVDFYNENKATHIHSYTGERFDPLPNVTDAKHYNGDIQVPVVSDETPDRPLQLINWKHTARGIGRTESSAWLREIQAENPLWINPVDAEKRGISNGQPVEIDAGRTTLEGVARVTEGIRPGVVGAAYAYGRNTNNAIGTTVEGPDKATPPEEPVDGNSHAAQDPFEPAADTTGYETGPGSGFAVNHLQTLDNELGDTGITDIAGGSHSQYDTFVEVRPTDR